MTKSVFAAAHFNNEAAAYAYVEARVWPNGRVCPHCGVVDKSGALQGKSNRIGLYKCYGCRKPFTVKVGTIFEASHIQLRDWLTAMHLVCSSKKGISANQLARTLGITLKSAWFMAHRIREAMSDGGAAIPFLGGEGGIVEVDETYVGGKPKNRKGGKVLPKQTVMALVDRSGEARSFHVRNVNSKTLWPILARNIAAEAKLMTDEGLHYKPLGGSFSSHETVVHSREEYARGAVSTNRVEGFFAILKRGITGTYQHVSEAHLKRYLWEFDFRYSNRVALGVDDTARADRALVGAKGKRLTYATTH